ncbi:MAG: hypothetical protein MMC23_008243 [Stictis urceolatum]|nr:hypothetical protein [Stictis urceolata]
MQGVQIAQRAVDVAQASYDAAMSKQAQIAAAMAEVERKLKRLQESGKTLNEIKAVLRDCISVLVDLSIQVGKLEQFSTMLTTVIDTIFIPRANDFTQATGKAGKRALTNRALKFSLLADISTMYSQIHMQYIMQGIDLCAMISKGTASHDPMLALQAHLADYTRDSGKKVAELVKEDAVTARGITLNTSAKAAIEQGAAQRTEDAKAIVDSTVSETVKSSEEVDGGAL